jgi:hypothetical protein
MAGDFRFQKVAPLQPITLASVKTWGIRWELAV